MNFYNEVSHHSCLMCNIGYFCPIRFRGGGVTCHNALSHQDSFVNFVKFFYSNLVRIKCFGFYYCVIDAVYNCIYSHELGFTTTKKNIKTVVIQNGNQATKKISWLLHIYYNGNYPLLIFIRVVASKINMFKGVNISLKARSHQEE